MNKSNVSLDNFTWQDTLPTQALRVDRIYTGTWNENLEYSIWYKTNKNDYKMLADGLSTQVNNEVSFKTAQLEEDEFIVEYEFRFGKVRAGFSEVESPVLYCDMLENLGNGFVFTNYTKVFGNYLDKYVEDTDEWTTVTYFKEIETTKNYLKQDADNIFIGIEVKFYICFLKLYNICNMIVFFIVYIYERSKNGGNL